MLHTLHSCAFDSHRLLFEGIIPFFFILFLLVCPVLFLFLCRSFLK